MGRALSVGRFVFTGAVRENWYWEKGKAVLLGEGVFSQKEASSWFCGEKAMETVLGRTEPPRETAPLSKETGRLGVMSQLTNWFLEYRKGVRFCVSTENTDSPKATKVSFSLVEKPICRVIFAAATGEICIIWDGKSNPYNFSCSEEREFSRPRGLTAGR